MVFLQKSRKTYLCIVFVFQTSLGSTWTDIISTKLTQHNMRILLLGSGGREHAFAWKLVQSEQCEQLYVAPGNAGTDTIAKT